MNIQITNNEDVFTTSWLNQPDEVLELMPGNKLYVQSFEQSEGDFTNEDWDIILKNNKDVLKDVLDFKVDLFDIGTVKDKVFTFHNPTKFLVGSVGHEKLFVVVNSFSFELTTTQTKTLWHKGEKSNVFYLTMKNVKFLS